MVTVASFMGVVWPSDVGDCGRQEHQKSGDDSRPESSLEGRSDSGSERDRSREGSG